jgi:hypothetical protein
MAGIMLLFGAVLIAEAQLTRIRRFADEWLAGESVILHDGLDTSADKLSRNSSRNFFRSRLLET